MLAIALNQKRNTKYTDLKLYAMVDDEDYKFIDAYHWSVVKKAHTFYAVTAIPGGRLVYMHHLIMTPEPGKEVDHRNRNGLDNRRDNLRQATRQQNMANMRHRQSNVTSLYHGVYWHRAARRWCAQIAGCSRRRYLGLFDREEDAALAYDEAARELFGEQ